MDLGKCGPGTAANDVRQSVYRRHHAVHVLHDMSGIKNVVAGLMLDVLDNLLIGLMCDAWDNLSDTFGVDSLVRNCVNEKHWLEGVERDYGNVTENVVSVMRAVVKNADADATVGDCGCEDVGCGGSDCSMGDGGGGEKKASSWKPVQSL